MQYEITGDNLQMVTLRLAPGREPLLRRAPWST